MNCSTVNNKATERVGAIQVIDCLFEHCLFANNSADGDGGALYNIGGVTLNDCRFTDNRAGEKGGAYSRPARE